MTAVSVPSLPMHTRGSSKRKPLRAASLGETYAARDLLDGAIDVTVTSDHDTVPTIGVDHVDTYDFDAVASGWVELASEHTIVTVEASQAAADRATAAGSLGTLDAVYDIHAEMRGALPFSGQLPGTTPSR